MSRTVVILVVSWLCIFSISEAVSAREATLGASCNDTGDCAETIEICTNGSCDCSNGYFNVSDVCKSSSITVTLTTQSTSVVYGSDVVLTTSITSEVPINPIKWLNGSTELVIALPKYAQSGEGPGQVTLTIHNLNFGDTGAYQVEVGNIAGVTSKSNQVSLTVTGEKPTVTVPGTITETGTTVTIPCTASVTQGSPVLSAVYWLFNGTNLVISNSAKYSGGIVSNPSLSIKNIGPTDAGEYHCGATNLLGSTTSSQSVTLAPPSNVHISATQTVDPIYNGSSITFTGSFTSKLHTENKWQNLIGAVFTDINITDERYTGSSLAGSTPKLVINSVDFIDGTSFRLIVTNGVGFTQSENITLVVVDGSISVTLTQSSTSVKYGVDVTLTAMIESPANVNSIKWQKVSGGSASNVNMDPNKYTQTGSGPGTVTLMIKNVDFTDSGNYQVQVSNIAGTIKTSNKVSMNVKALEFNDNCNNTDSCNSSIHLECSNNKCLCVSDYYHKEQVCYAKSRLAPTITGLTSTTSSISVFWSPPNIDLELVTEYEVNWKVNGSIEQTSGRLNKSMNSHTVSSGLMSGQLYIVKVISHGILTNPAESIVVTSNDSLVRLDPLSPGPILNESNFAHTGLRIGWTAPDNTFVTRYEVTIDDATYNTSSNSITLAKFNGKSFTPGAYYYVKIATVSGETLVKKSPEHAEWIRIYPTQPGPPTNVRCPGTPLHVSLHITWEAPTNSNGIIQSYMIDVSPRMPSIINTSSNITNEIVDGLQPDKTYTFTVRTVNDADESIRISDPSQSVSCKTRAGEKPSVVISETITQTEYTTVTIHCTATVQPGSPAITAIQWLLNGQNKDISDANKYSGGNVNTPSLTIKNLGSTDAGEYHCRATNLVGSTTSSQSVTLASPSYVQILVTQPVNPVYNGGSITFTGSFTSKLRTENKWQKLIGADFTNIDITDERYAGSSLAGPTPKLVITKVDFIDRTSLRLIVANGVGFTSSESITLNVVDGSISVTLTPSSTSLKYGENVILTATIESPANVNSIKWQKVSGESVSDLNLNLDKYTQTGSGSGTVTLTINNVDFTDSGNYRVQVSNIAGTTKTSNLVSLNMKEFNDNCTNTESCNSSEKLECRNKCLCVSEYYHKGQVCFAKTRLAPTITELTSTTSAFSVFWSPLIIDSYLVTGYEVTWRATSSMEQSSGRLNKSVNSQTVASGLLSGQLYIVKVISHGNLTNPAQSFVVASNDSLVRLDTLSPGPILNESNFAHTGLRISWTAPDNTFVTRYEVTIDDTTYNTSSNSITLAQLNGKSFTPGAYYYVKIATVSGETLVKKSPAHAEWIRIIPTQISEKAIPSTATIIGIIFAITLFVSVVVIGILLWKRNRRHEKHKNQANTYADLNLDERTKADQPYSILEHGSRTVQSKSVPLNFFFDYVVDLLRNNRQKLTKEYHDLLQYTERAASTVASSKHNVSKNRGNIIPYDFNRVKLCSPGASDYIDASFLLEKLYILTSYPFAKTFGNFWQMVWEQNTSTIVVITGHSGDKEAWYFSDIEGTVRTIERIDVELLAKFKSCESVTMRKIKLSRGKHSKVVNHFHVSSLEITDLPDQILALINTITQNNVKNTGPQVVHGGCTGVDNSGVFIAVDHVVKSIVSGGNEIDVYGTARTVMKERMFSISSLEQYSAIYTCLQKYLQNSPACKNDAMGAYEYLP